MVIHSKGGGGGGGQGKGIEKIIQNIYFESVNGDGTYVYPGDAKTRLRVIYGEVK